MERDELRQRALDAYERGRLVVAVQHASISLVVGGAALVIHGASASLMALVVFAVVLHTVSVYRHDDFKRGATLGAGLGFIQLIAALFMTTIGMRWFPVLCDTLCFGIVFSGSIVVGASFARSFAPRRRSQALRALAIMLPMGATLAIVGCIPGSAGLLVGSLVGLALGAAPGFVAAGRAVS